MNAPAERRPNRPSHLVPFLWLFLASALIKVDNEEAIHPFFRLMVFIALPFALAHLASVVARARFTPKLLGGLLVFGYLMFYPLATMSFGIAEDEERHVKDWLYVLSLYCILFFLIRRYFSKPDGELDVQSLGRFWVSFTLLQSVLAVAMFLGLTVPIGFGLEFHQMEWLGTRLHGFMGTSSHLGPMVAVACAFLITQRMTHITGIKLAFLFMVLVMTGSRGALAGFLGAALLYGITNLHRMRLRVGAMLPILFGAIVIVGIALAFSSQTEEVVSMATRSDPEGWEKSRPVMWALRLAEFLQQDTLTQLVGAGHRAIGQTFNVNIEYLVNYGLIYLVIFNIVYFAVAWRFFLRSWRDRDPDAAFLFMIAVCIYLFMQGLSTIFYAFFHATHICMLMLLISYLQRKPVRATERGTTPRVGSDPTREAGLTC
jgi:hypothetical protein